MSWKIRARISLTCSPRGLHFWPLGLNSLTVTMYTIIAFEEEERILLSRVLWTSAAGIDRDVRRSALGRHFGLADQHI